jgi:thiol-disulfide isomerase/thioredoxin
MRAISYRFWLTSAVVCLLVLSATSWLSHASDLQPLMNKPAPDFTLPLLKGGEAKLSDQKGKVVVLDVWASWCPPCIASFPKFDALAAKLAEEKADVVIWGVNVDMSRPRAEKTLARFPLSVPIPLADKAWLETYRIEYLPAHIVIGKDGKVKYGAVVEDIDKGAKDLEAAIRKALAE